MNLQSANGTGHDIRVLLVDDSPLSIEIIRRMLATAPEIQVVGTASNGAEAMELIPRVRPDVICTDLHMPKMGGLEFTREVMARNPPSHPGAERVGPGGAGTQNLPDARGRCA